MKKPIKFNRLTREEFYKMATTEGAAKLRANAAAARRAPSSAFTWSRSPEGAEFWVSISQRLMEIAEFKPKKPAE